MSSSLILPGNGELSPRQLRGVARQLQRHLQQTGKRGQLVIHETNFARAYVYDGEWVADCPAGCGSTQWITDKPDDDRYMPWTGYTRLDKFECSNRMCWFETASIHWPPTADVIIDILDCRPFYQNRNWYPEGHKVAVAHGIPDGQTPADLIRENTAHDVPTRVEILQKMPELAEGAPWRGLPR